MSLETLRVEVICLLHDTTFIYFHLAHSFWSPDKKTLKTQTPNPDHETQPGRRERTWAYKPVIKGPAHAGGGCGCESLRSLCVSFVSWDSSGVTGALMGSPRLSVVRLGHTTANTVYSVVASRVTRISHQDISDISGVTRTTATLPGWLSLGSGSMSSPSGLTN